jgi:GTP-binding protein Era
VTTESLHRSGFAAFVGRPNAGKSTLINALVGTKVAITSGKPQTTRRTLRGIVHRPDAQLVVVDTPGLHRPRTLLGERTNAAAHEALAAVDVVVLCVPADQPVGTGDRFIASQLALLTPRPVIVAAVTKTDLVSREKLAAQLVAVQKLEDVVGELAEIVPVSAVAGDQVALLADLLVARLPEGPPLYPQDVRSDSSREEMIAELVREAALEGVRNELPHSLAAEVEEILPRPGKDLLDVRVTVYVERTSQRAIVVGKGGQRLKEVGTKARAGIEELVGGRVHLDLHVKVAPDWQRDPKALQRLGF